MAARRLRSDTSMGLSSRLSSPIGVLLPDFSNPFFGNLAAAVDEALRKAGYQAILVGTDEDADRERAQVRELEARGVDGLLIVPVGQDYEHLEALQAEDLPFVLMDRTIEELGSDWVGVENQMSSCQLCETLFSHGAQRVGFIGGEAQVFTHRQRLEGYRAALRRQRLAFSKELVFLGTSSEETGRQGVGKFLELKDPPDAIFCSNNKIFAGCLDALAGAPRVPWAHLPMACFDEVPFMAHLGRPVLVVAQPETEIGRRGVGLLLERIRKPAGERCGKPYQQILLEVEQKAFGF